MGETAETLPELEELQSIRERLLSPYSRLHTLLLRAAESQPVVPNDVLNSWQLTVDSWQRGFEDGDLNPILKTILLKEGDLDP